MSMNYYKVAAVTAAAAFGTAVACHYLNQSMNKSEKEQQPNEILKLPVIDLLKLFNKAENEAQYEEECRKVAKSLREYGIVVVKDPRVSEADNDRFISIMERYFESSDGIRDARPEYQFQIGVTPDGTELPRNHCGKMGALGPGNKPLSPCPPEKDPKWRFFWRTGYLALQQTV